MRFALVLSLILAVPAMAADLSWSEDFNSYPTGNPDWGAGAVANGWTMPSNNVKMDGYLPSGGSGLAPRLSSADQSCITNLGGGVYNATASKDITLSYRAGFSRDGGETEYLNGHDFIALGKTQADIDAIPHDRYATLATPVDAIALGHQANQALYFFDGDSWTNIGNYSTALPYANNMRYNTGLVTVTITANGDVTISAPSSTGTDTFNIGAGFEFSYLGIDHVNASPVSYAPASYDDINLEAAPEPASLLLLALGLPLLRRRRH